MPALRTPLVFAARLLLGHFFVWEGWLKIVHYAAIQDYMESYAVPGGLLPLVILAEFGGGLAVILGLFARLAALGLAGYCVATAFFFHTDFADPMQVFQFHKNFVVAGGFLLLAAHGPGPMSIDARLFPLIGWRAEQVSTGLRWARKRQDRV